MTSTTSGSYSFNYTLLQLCTAAARKLGAIQSGEALAASAFQDFSDQLNMMVKALNATGLHIWTEEEAILFLQPNQVQYTLGGSTTDNAAWTNFTATTLSSAASSGATSVVVSSGTGFTSGGYVGVVLNSGSISWSTQTSTSGTTINLSAGLSGAANAGNAVYTYTQQIQRPLRVISARRYNFASAIDAPMDPMMSRLDYRAMPNKTTTGTPTRAFYDPRGGANSQGQIFIWPAPPDVTNAIKFTWWRSIQDFSTNSNISDLPTEWLDFLIWGLAEKMAPEYDCPAPRYEIIQQQAQGALELVSGWDREPESYLFGFNADQTGP